MNALSCRRTLTFSALAGGLAMAVSTGCGGDDSAASSVDAALADIDADPEAPDAAAPDAAVAREVIMETQPLVPGEIVEGIMTGGPADFSVIHLEAPVAKLDWNIHGHADGGTQTVYEELDQMTVDYTFAPTAEADWYLLLRNGGSTAMDVLVRVELHGAMTWEWQ